MSRRKLSNRTKLAATLLARGEIPYSDAKLMSEDQLISLYHFDHNIYHESEHPDRDLFWNLKPMPIREHREKTKQDAKIIAKGRRLRAKMGSNVTKARAEFETIEDRTSRIRRRKITSRGFDTRYTRKVDGTVVPRKPHKPK
jgi:hypothetical protein